MEETERENTAYVWLAISLAHTVAISVSIDTIKLFQHISLGRAASVTFCIYWRIWLFCIFAAALHAANATPRFGHFASFGATNMRRVHRWKNKFPFDGHGISDCKGNGKGMECKAREGKGLAGDWKWSQVHSAFGILINIKECRKKNWHQI